MKPYQHILIVTAIIVMIYFMYDAGFGAVPFLLAAFYLALVSLDEFKRLKKRKRW